MAKAFEMVSADEVAERLDHYVDMAMRRPVGIQRPDSACLVMLPVKEYERLARNDRERATYAEPASTGQN